MSAYTDVTDFLSTWPEDDVGQEHVQEAAEIAYEYINSALAAVYGVPFEATYPSVIVKISNLLTRSIAISIVSKGRVAISDIKKNSAVDPIEWLQAIREGRYNIPGVGRTSGTGAYLTTEGQMHVFDMDHEIYHQVDEDRLDDLADDREAY